MTTIGQFRRATDGSFAGEIITLSVQAQNVRIDPTELTGPNSPTHRILVGAAHIGDGWATDQGTLRLTLDDPSFAAAIEAELREETDGAFSLIWQRRRQGSLC